MSSAKRKVKTGARTDASSTKASPGRSATPSDGRQALREFLQDVLPPAEHRADAIRKNNAMREKLTDVPSEIKDLPDFLRELLDVHLEGLEKFHRVYELLVVAKNVRIFYGPMTNPAIYSDKDSDSLRERAAKWLTRLAFSESWETINKEELAPLDPQSVKTPLKKPGGTDALLLFVSLHHLDKNSANLGVCISFTQSSTVDPLGLLKRLLSWCAFHMMRLGLNCGDCKLYTTVLEVLLKDKDMVKYFMNLLESEEKSSLDFFQFEGVGSLMSVSFIPTIDKEMREATFPFNDSKLLEEKVEIQLKSLINDMVITTEKVHELFSFVFQKFLLLQDSQEPRTALCWMAAAMNKTSKSLTDASSHIVADDNACKPGFLMNLCCVMLECFEVYHRHHKLSGTIDLGYFSSQACKIDSRHLINMAGDPIKRKSSGGKSRFGIGTECFCLCLLAVHLGVLNTMSLALNWKEGQVNQSSDKPDGSAKGRLTLDLMTLALGNESLCERVHKIYLILCDCLTDENLDISDIPRFCITGMTNWISGLELLEIEVKNFQPGKFLKVAVRSLLDIGSKLSCLLRFQLIQTIVICVRKLPKHEALTILPAEVKELCGVLVETFVDVSSLEGLQVLSGTFSTCSARLDIVELFLFWKGDDLAKALVASRKPHSLLPFLSAVLEMTIMQSQSAPQIIQQRRKTEAERTSESNRHEPAPVNSEASVVERLLGNQKVFEFFSLLVKDEHCAGSLTRPPLAVQTAVAVACLCNCLILEGTGDTNLHGLIQKLAAEDARTKGSFLWSLADWLEFRQRIKCYDVISKMRLSDLFEELIDKRDQYQYIRSESPSGQNAPRRLFQDTFSQGSVTTASLVQSHSFRAVLETYKPASKKIEILKKEMEHLRKELPRLSDKTVFVVRDSERYDVLRCVVSGPVDTPYSGGLFAFDVYCPDGYPSVPPLVRFLTTGYGTADFHACLHVNGEVFLNLLGTGSDDDGSDSWNPNKSTLLDVLESIQNVIFKGKPFFSYESIKSREKSQKEEFESQRHDTQVQLLTLRYARLEQVRNPPAGLEGVIQQFFHTQRPALKDMQRQLMEEPSKELTDYTEDGTRQH